MKQKILIVEDDQYIRELYEGVLTDAGYEVDTANDGQEDVYKRQIRKYPFFFTQCFYFRRFYEFSSSRL